MTRRLLSEIPINPIGSRECRYCHAPYCLNYFATPELVICTMPCIECLCVGGGTVLSVFARGMPSSDSNYFFTVSYYEAQRYCSSSAEEDPTSPSPRL
jgi:hypothetical protein